MRTHPSYMRTRDMITAPEIPRLKSGGIALCHFCQRAVYFAKGFLNLVIRDVEREAHEEQAKRGRKTALTSG